MNFREIESQLSISLKSFLSDTKSTGMSFVVFSFHRDEYLYIHSSLNKCARSASRTAIIRVS